MDGFLRQSTAKTVRIGPFVDWSDASTPENALSIGFSDVFLSKAGATFAAKSDVTAPTSDGTLGYYACELATQDVGTVGLLKLHTAPTGALPVWHDFAVLPANQYDAMFSDTGQFRADVVEVGGVAVNVISDFRLTAADVWAVADRTLTAGTNLNIPTSDANATSVWAAAARTLTTPTSDFKATGFSTHVASDIWSVAARILTAGTNINIPTSDQNAVATWAAATRTLTTPASDFYGPGGSLSSDAVATAVWAETVRTLTTPASDFYGPGGSLTASDVWAAASRTLTTPTSDFKATGFSTHAAADIWSVAARTITTPTSDFKLVASDVWSVAARTLTADTNINYPSSDAIAVAVSDAVWGAAAVDNLATKRSRPQL